MSKKYVIIEVHDEACRRTKNRFSKFKKEKYRIELIKQKINEVLTGDGFFVGEPMSYFGIDVYKNDLWARGWEGWIPDSEITITETDNLEEK